MEQNNVQAQQKTNDAAKSVSESSDFEAHEASIKEAFGLGDAAAGDAATGDKKAAPPAAKAKDSTVDPGDTKQQITPEQRAETIEKAKLARQVRELREAMKGKDEGLSKFEAIKARLRDTSVDPVEQAEILRRELGLDLNEFTDRTLKLGKAVKSPAERKVEELEQWRQEREKADAESAKKAREFEGQQRVSKEREFVRGRITEMADRYPILAKTGMTDLVVNEAYARQAAGNIAPTDTFEDLAADVEAKLKTQLTATISAWKKSGVLDAILALVRDDDPAKSETKKPSNGTPKTLTSAHGTSDPQKKLDRSKLSDEEKKILAITESFDWHPPTDE